MRTLRSCSACSYQTPRSSAETAAGHAENSHSFIRGASAPQKTVRPPRLSPWDTAVWYRPLEVARVGTW